MNDDLVLDFLLGWLSPAKRRNVGRRLEIDPAAQAQIDSWHDCLVPLNTLSTPVAPPAELWAGILARLNGKQAQPHARSRAWGWAVSGASLAALASMVLMLAPAKTLYRAELRDAAHPQEMATAEFTRDHDLIITNKTLSSPPTGKSLELWIIPSGGIPQPLGIISSDQPSRLHVPGSTSNATVAISVEPAGGSPTPTGPIVVSGKLSAL